ncbi:MAG TPA: HlyD family efflux transporter periplasmic adaptor subunit [Candidatus Paceibacterota bacterium]|nr:HlyD family efflux transporter periplasmic adaptor subunit [Candidatus Paceibacterota bacterium]
MQFFSRLVQFIKNLPRLYSIGGALVIIAIGAVGVHYFTRGATADSTPAQITHVKIASVASLSSQAGPLPLVGKVTSLNQATILAQTSGEITSLSKRIGDRVGAGEIIAEFANASEAAAVQQAQGSYDAAEAAYESAQNVTAANASLTSSQAASAASSAQTSATAALQSAYASLDDAVHTKSDELFTNPRTQTPQLILSLPDSQLSVNLINQRLTLEKVLQDAHTQANSSASIDTRIDASTADARTVLAFINDCVEAVNEAIATQTVSATEIAAFQTSIGAARTETTAAISALSSAKSSYDSAQTTSQTAANTAGPGSQQAVAQAKANVQVALGALDVAKANLEKTIVRSPISGTIVSLPITQGDFVSSFAQVAQVSNPGALEIDAYVTPDDAKTLQVGGKASIENGVSGVITSIAPAIDPSTGEILVKIGITSGQSSLTDGDTVTVSLERAIPLGTKKTTTASSTSILIPIIAVKLIPNGAEVFTVSSSTLVSHPIVLGAIQGDQVTATSGLTTDMDIVTDARGLTDGQQVVVDQ